MFVLGTSTVVAYVPTNDIDLVGPLPQVLRAGFGPFGIAAPARDDRDPDDARDARRRRRACAFTAVTRLPMVAGWDRLLPAWFSRLHATYRTPVNSIVLVGACAFGIALLSLIGVGQAEAFQLLFNASGMFYALTYVVMFAIPLFGLRGVAPRPPLWLRMASASGLADDGALRRAVGVPDHQGGERGGVRGQDLTGDRGREPRGRGHSRICAAAATDKQRIRLNETPAHRASRSTHCRLLDGGTIPLRRR